MYRLLFLFFAGLLLAACSHTGKDKGDNAGPASAGVVTDPVVQDSLFRRLARLTQNSIDANRQNDSLAFLFLPLQASCPACRRKAIESIVKYRDRLDDKHYVIITGGGEKLVKEYFEQQEREVPFAGSIFYDTAGLAASNKISAKNPNVYYSYDRKVYRKVSCVPATIKRDLEEFFKGL